MQTGKKLILLGALSKRCKQIGQAFSYINFPFKLVFPVMSSGLTISEIA